jgi:Tfp pilus assembly protein PilF
MFRAILGNDPFMPHFRLTPCHSLIVLFAAACLCGCNDKSASSAPANAVVTAMNRGVSAMGQYQYEAAVDAFQEVLKLSPNLDDARLNLAIALFNRNRKEDLEQGSKLLEELLRKNPENTQALYFQAIILQHVGKAEQAVPLLEKVVKRYPEDGAVWYVLGLCRLRLGQPCAPEFLKAVQYRPYLFSAYYQLYQSALRENEPDKATEYLEKFKRLRESPLGESIELPQYNQMGELALVQPLAALLPAGVSSSRLSLREALAISVPGNTAVPPASAAIGDTDTNSLADILLPVASGFQLWTQTNTKAFSPAAELPGASGTAAAVSAAMGDFDNDGQLDLCLTRQNSVQLLKRSGTTFTDVTASLGLPATAGRAFSSVFADGDHDGDLDLLICSEDGLRVCQNNGDGTFTNSVTLRPTAGSGGVVAVLTADIDNDRDTDLITLSEHGAPQLFVNELLGRFVPGESITTKLEPFAGMLQDFNGDGIPDLVLAGAASPGMELWLGDGHGHFKPSDSIKEAAASLASWGRVEAFRGVDLDLDGDLDLVCACKGIHALLNDGRGRFSLAPELFKPASGSSLSLVECADITGDLVPDVLVWQPGNSNQLQILEGTLTPPSTALAIQPTGIRSRDGRTRCPGTAYGAKLTVRAGLREHTRIYSGQSGGPSQSAAPLILALNGSGKADYVRIGWSDGVAQVETGLVAGQIHIISELQRKISSCPVLFTWNGRRFEFITDFAGVGGLGYFAGPDTYSPPQVLEHIKIEPSQLQPTNGCYEIRLTEPMEESAYVDRLELLTVDHPADWAVYPDERLAISGAPPTHQLLVVGKRVFPVKATAPNGDDCVANVTAVDRVYAYTPPLDRRYLGYCKPHTLELEFGDDIVPLQNADRVFLFINGFFEYPYSQTVYAASQSRLAWEPIRIDCQEADGTWKTIVPDAGAPGGMGRMFTVDLSKLLGRARKLRLTTNLEIFYDQVFLAHDEGIDRVKVHSAKLKGADLRRVGFALEFSPDGHPPLIYDYELSEPSAPFHVLKGAYTRYGSVRELLAEFDDHYVIVGPGDEIALAFEAMGLEDLKPSDRRSFVLVSHSYCKDMDLYTGTPLTLEPLPFRGMTEYPYKAPITYPKTPQHQAYLREWNTRIVR